jgi:hypothetical protein
MILFVPVPCETLKFSGFWKTNFWIARGKTMIRRRDHPLIATLAHSNPRPAAVIAV